MGSAAASAPELIQGPAAGGTDRAGRRFFTIFFIPLIPLNKVGEHVQLTPDSKEWFLAETVRVEMAELSAAAGTRPARIRAALGSLTAWGIGQQVSDWLTEVFLHASG